MLQHIHSALLSNLVSINVLVKSFISFSLVCQFLANGLLKLLRVPIKHNVIEHLTIDELSTIVKEAGDKISDSHQDMLLAILELEKLTVDDIMIRRDDIVGIDLSKSWDYVCEKITTSQHTKLPVMLATLMH